MVFPYHLLFLNPEYIDLFSPGIWPTKKYQGMLILCHVLKKGQNMMKAFVIRVAFSENTHS